MMKNCSRNYVGGTWPAFINGGSDYIDALGFFQLLQSVRKCWSFI